MNRRLLSLTFCALLLASVTAIAQDSTGTGNRHDQDSTTGSRNSTTTTTTTQTTTDSNQTQNESQRQAQDQNQSSAQSQSNPMGNNWSVIAIPADKEVTLSLLPTTAIPGAKGTARIIRRGNETTINMDVSGLTGTTTTYHLYTVDPAGKLGLLGPISISNGTGTLTTRTPLDRFMLVLSPSNTLASLMPEPQIVLRSAAPEGYAVLPYAHSGGSDSATVGERVRATTTPGSTPAYNVPMLGIPTWRKGTDTHMKVNFTGSLTGSRANIFIEPRKDGATSIKVRFHEMKDAPAGKRLVLWAVSPTHEYHRLGQVINTGNRNEAEIESETALKDFGLFITAEDATSPPASPTGEMLGVFQR
jgi:hypothetical protein